MKFKGKKIILKSDLDLAAGFKHSLLWSFGSDHKGRSHSRLGSDFSHTKDASFGLTPS